MDVGDAATKNLVTEHRPTIPTFQRLEYWASTQAPIIFCQAIF
jgi:hypothetical protein